MKLKQLVGTTRLVSFPRTLRPRRRHTPLPPARALARRRSLPARGDAVPRARDRGGVCGRPRGLGRGHARVRLRGRSRLARRRDERVDFVALGCCDELCDGDDEARAPRPTRCGIDSTPSSEDRLPRARSARASPDLPRRVPLGARGQDARGGGVASRRVRVRRDQVRPRPSAPRGAPRRRRTRRGSRRGRAFLAEEADARAAELEADLERCRVAAPEVARLRRRRRATRLAPPSSARSPPQPGRRRGSARERVATLVPGHRYGLIGRNGKGKSTLLKYLAARRVRGWIRAVTVHYVSQEVALTARSKNRTSPASSCSRRTSSAGCCWRRPRAWRPRATRSRGRRPGEGERRRGSDFRGASRAGAECDERLLAIDAEGAPVARVLAPRPGVPRTAREPRDARAERRVEGSRVARGGALRATRRVVSRRADEPSERRRRPVARAGARDELKPGARASSLSCLTTATSWTRARRTRCTSAASRESSPRTRCPTARGRRSEEQQKALRTSAWRSGTENKLKLEAYAGHGFKGRRSSSSQINMMQRKANEAAKLDAEASDEAAELADLEEDAELPLKLASAENLRAPSRRSRAWRSRYPRVSSRERALDAPSRTWT